MFIERYIATLTFDFDPARSQRIIQSWEIMEYGANGDLSLAMVERSRLWMWTLAYAMCFAEKLTQ